jgi:hypothetical protein
LAQTLEPILEPDLPICDYHHHFWVHRPEPPAYQRYLLANRDIQGVLVTDGYRAGARVLTQIGFVLETSIRKLRS